MSREICPIDGHYHTSYRCRVCESAGAPERVKEDCALCGKKTAYKRLYCDDCLNDGHFRTATPQEIANCEAEYWDQKIGEWKEDGD